MGDDNEMRSPDPQGGTDASELASMLLGEQADNKRRTSIILAQRVQDTIGAVPMNQGMTWAEFSRRCYESFGRYNPNHSLCNCGTVYHCGASGICRKCGQKTRVNKHARAGHAGPDLCWTQDLYELTSPLLDPSVKLNHSEQQYALRAVSQRLKTPPRDWNGPGQPLRSAVDAGCADLVCVMLQAGISANEVDDRGVTPLHTAIFAGRLDICRMLLEGRSDVNACDKHGQTPLFFAATVAGCSSLCEYQADISAVNLKGQSALHFAARAGLRDVLNWLSNRCSKAVVDLRDSHGATAEHFLKLKSPNAPNASEDDSDSHGVASTASASLTRGKTPTRKWQTRVKGGAAPKAAVAKRDSVSPARSSGRLSASAASPDKESSYAGIRSSDTHMHAELHGGRPSVRQSLKSPAENAVHDRASLGGLDDSDGSLEHAGISSLSLGGLHDMDQHPEITEGDPLSLESLDDAF